MRAAMVAASTTSVPEPHMGSNSGSETLAVIASPGRVIDAFALARAHHDGALIINDGFEPDTARAALRDGIGDAVSFGRHYVGNPDLVERIAQGLPLAPFDRKTLYTPGAKGYTDYPRATPA